MGGRSVDIDVPKGKKSTHDLFDFTDKDKVVGSSQAEQAETLSPGCDKTGPRLEHRVAESRDDVEGETRQKGNGGSGKGRIVALQSRAWQSLGATSTKTSEAGSR